MIFSHHVERGVVQTKFAAGANLSEIPSG